MINHDFLAAAIDIALSSTHVLTTRIEAVRVIVNSVKIGNEFELKNLVIDRPTLIDAVVLGLKIFKQNKELLSLLLDATDKLLRLDDTKLDSCCMSDSNSTEKVNLARFESLNLESVLFEV